MASRLARASLTDKQLLGTSSKHQALDDYAGITPFLTPEAIRYLRDYVSDQSTNSKHFYLAAQLALASVTRTKGADQNSTAGTLFVNPFTPTNYRATLDPKVGLGKDGVTIVVTGRCSVSYNVVQKGTPKTVTLARTRFTYYLQPEASKADARVGVSGWQSDSTATYTAR